MINISKPNRNYSGERFRPEVKGAPEKALTKAKNIDLPPAYVPVGVRVKSECA